MKANSTAHEQAATKHNDTISNYASWVHEFNDTWYLASSLTTVVFALTAIVLFRSFRVNKKSFYIIMCAFMMVAMLAGAASVKLEDAKTRAYANEPYIPYNETSCYYNKNDTACQPLRD